jgi:neutral amino acid transport system substrate-binding protein
MYRIRPWRATALVGIAAAMSLGVAACGSSDGGSDGGGTAVIGVASPLSGEAAVWGEPVDRVTRAVVKEINDTGGIDGTKLKVVTEDEKFNTEDGVRVVNKLVNKDDAQFIIGPTSGTLMATLGFAKRNEVVIASPYSGIVEFDEKSGGDFAYRTVGPDNFDGLTVALNFRDQGFDRIAILSESNDSSLSTSRYVQEYFEKMGGQVVSNVKFNAGQSSYIAEVRKAFENDPQAVFLAASGEPAVPILREAHRDGFGDVPFSVLAELATDQFAAEVGPEIMEGQFGQQTVAADDSPAYAHMTELLKATYPGKEGEELAATAAVPQTYDAMVIAGLAMIAGGEATATAINDNYRKVGGPPGKKVSTYEEGKAALEAGEDIDYVGASGSLDFNETGTAAPDYGVYQVKNGKFEVVKRYPSTELFKQVQQLSQ